MTTTNLSAAACEQLDAFAWRIARASSLLKILASSLEDQSITIGGDADACEAVRGVVDGLDQVSEDLWRTAGMEC